MCFRKLTVMPSGEVLELRRKKKETGRSQSERNCRATTFDTLPFFPPHILTMFVSSVGRGVIVATFDWLVVAF